jgi:glycosyltransferase involved in cell wall biosynthesis
MKVVSLLRQLLARRAAVDPRLREVESELHVVRGQWRDAEALAASALSEASRINALYVEAGQRAASTEMELAAAQAALRQLTGKSATAGQHPVVTISADGPSNTYVRGKWGSSADPAAEWVVKDFLHGLKPSSGSRFDLAILLMFPGWEQELRGTRWHVARYLANIMPVVLVQPVLLYQDGGPRLRPDKFLKGVFVLEVLVHQPAPAQDLLEPLHHLADIAWVIQHLRADRPLFWLFSPYLARAFALSPPGGRLLHATEDWPDFPGVSLFAQHGYAEAVAAADVVVAIGEGVSRNLPRAGLSRAPLVVTGGCDFAAFENAQPNATIATLRRAVKRPLCVLAGNIDRRVDFALLEQAVRGVPELFFCLVGPVRELAQEDRADWDRLLQAENVCWLGPFAPDDLPSLYSACDVGIIPYKRLDPIVRSFPLKLLEMGAAGIPVVTTWMESILGLGDAVFVTRDREEFVQRLKAIAAGSVDREAVGRLKELARQNDYQAKFDDLLRVMDSVPIPPERDVSVAGARLKPAEAIKLGQLWQTAQQPGHRDTRRALLTLCRALRRLVGRRHISARRVLFEIATMMEDERPAAAARLYRACLDWEPCADDHLASHTWLAAWRLCRICLRSNDRSGAATFGRIAVDRAAMGNAPPALQGEIATDMAEVLVLTGKPAGT